MSAAQPPSTELIKVPESPLLVCEPCGSDKVRIVEAGQVIVKMQPEALYHHIYICCGECCQERNRYVSGSQLESAYRVNDLRSVAIADDLVLLSRANFADAIEMFAHELDLNLVVPEDF